jgi:hypothetical protein
MKETEFPEDKEDITLLEKDYDEDVTDTDTGGGEEEEEA